MADRPARPGAGPSENEIEITPAMIAAGDAVWRAMQYEWWATADEARMASVLSEVYRAMNGSRGAS